MVLPSVAKELGLQTSFSGGWLIDYAQKLAEAEGVELATMTYANVDKYIDAKASGMRNFIFPGAGKRLLFSSKKTVEDCKKVLEAFEPDIIHIHGTEYAIGPAMLKTGTKVPILLTIQGILTNIYREYYGGIPTGTILKMGSLKDWIKGKNPIFVKTLYKKNAEREREVLRNVKYVTGRTLWDKSVMLAINPDLRYFRLNYNLRPEFYGEDSWTYESMTPHVIYTGAASYPLKGLHILLRAVAIVKRAYPDVRLRIPGGSVRKNAYEKYIDKWIKKLDIQENVEFIGRKDANGVIEELTRANVCVVPSAMEGASATICEAMKIGTPCICAYRGGMTDLLREGESGYYYDFEEYPVLAEKICAIFKDERLSRQFSDRAKQDALLRHDRNKNFRELTEIYRQIVNTVEE